MHQKQTRRGQPARCHAVDRPHHASSLEGGRPRAGASASDLRRRRRPTDVRTRDQTHTHRAPHFDHGGRRPPPTSARAPALSSPPLNTSGRHGCRTHAAESREVPRQNVGRPIHHRRPNNNGALPVLHSERRRNDHSRPTNSPRQARARPLNDRRHTSSRGDSADAHPSGRSHTHHRTRIAPTSVRDPPRSNPSLPSPRRRGGGPLSPRRRDPPPSRRSGTSPPSCRRGGTSPRSNPSKHRRLNSSTRHSPVNPSNNSSNTNRRATASPSARMSPRADHSFDERRSTLEANVPRIHHNNSRHTPRAWRPQWRPTKGFGLNFSPRDESDSAPVDRTRHHHHHHRRPIDASWTAKEAFEKFPYARSEEERKKISKSHEYLQCVFVLDFCS